jgi:hypothetical protein
MGRGYFDAHYDIETTPHRAMLRLYRCHYCHDWGDSWWLRGHRCQLLPWPLRAFELHRYALMLMAWVSRAARKVIFAWQVWKTSK